MNLKVVLGAVAAVAALGGGAGGAYYVMSGGAGSGEARAEQTVHQDGGPRNGPVYLALEPLAAPVRRDDRVRHYIFLSVSLQIRDLDTKAEVAAQKPKIHDALIQELHRRSIIDPEHGEQIDFIELKKRLLRQVHTIFDAEIVQDVLITNAVKGAPS